MSSVRAFANENRESPLREARCSWCNNNPVDAGKRELYDVKVTSSDLGDLIEKGRVCSSECANAWRAWARERIERLNKAFPA